MKALTLMTAIAFAPADLAHAGPTTTDTPVLEIVTFRLKPGTVQDQFLSAAQGTEAMLRDRGALTRRFLTVDDTGLWTDVIEWTSMGEALAAAEAVMVHPDFAPFGALIDEASVTMRHAPILYRMD